MPLSANANKWAPKLVITLQLFTWTVVGLIFLQRGAISLGANVEDRKNDTHVQVIAANTSKVDAPSAMLSRREPLRLERHGRQQVGETIRRDGNNRDAWYRTKTRKESFFGIIPRSIESGEQGLPLSDKQIRDIARINESTIPSHENTTRSSSYDYFLGNADNDVLVEGVRGGERNDHVQLSPVNRAGAAAALVMLAIGVVMLLLGPAIVILRAFDTRRRDRRSPKSRTRKDLPPTYEQATSMDQVPRYSTLRLNLISEPTAFPLSPTENHESLFVFSATENN